MDTTQDDPGSAERRGSPPSRTGRRPTIESIDDVNRFASDGLLLRMLCQDPVDRPVRDSIAKELIRYGVGTLVPRMAIGGVVPLMRGVGVRQLPTVEQLGRMRADADYRQDMAHMATADAFVKLEADAHAGRGWSETSRQSLGTYFVGGAVFALADLLRAGRRSAREVARTDSIDEFTDGDGRFSVADVLPDIEVAAATRVLVSQKLRELEHDDRLLVLYKAWRFTEREIAETIGKSPKAVEHRWARLKRLHPWVARVG